MDLELTLRCAQGHRWRKDKEHPGWYNTVLNIGDAYSTCTGRGKHEFVWIRQIKDALGFVEFDAHVDTEHIHWVREKLCWQFRLDDDITTVYCELRKIDDAMEKLVTAYSGLRVMRVDPWECLMFFTMSNNKQVQGIHSNMEKLSNAFGTVLSNTQRKTFPSATALETKTQKQVKQLGLGFDSWLPQLILDKACSRLRGQLRSLEQMSYTEAVEEIAKGKNVADKGG